MHGTCIINSYHDTIGRLAVVVVSGGGGGGAASFFFVFPVILRE